MLARSAKRKSAPALASTSTAFGAIAQAGTVEPIGSVVFVPFQALHLRPYRAAIHRPPSLPSAAASRATCTLAEQPLRLAISPASLPQAVERHLIGSMCGNIGAGPKNQRERAHFVRFRAGFWRTTGRQLRSLPRAANCVPVPVEHQNPGQPPPTQK